MNIPFKKTKRGIAFRVKVEPRSSKKGISGLLGEAVKIKVHSPPVGGAANEELREILAEEFGIRKSAIRIVSGRSSKEKTVEIEGIDTIP